LAKKDGTNILANGLGIWREWLMCCFAIPPAFLVETYLPIPFEKRFQRQLSEEVGHEKEKIFLHLARRAFMGDGECRKPPFCLYLMGKFFPVNRK